MNTSIIKGSCADAVIYTVDNSSVAVKPYALAQLRQLCDNEAARESRIRVMPDVHPGNGTVIGLTMTLGERVLPSLVGSDIGCGVTMAKLRKFRPDFQRLDAVIRERIPSGFRIRTRPHALAKSFDPDRLQCIEHVRRYSPLLGLGTLGGGNHFIEVDRGEDDSAWLVIHSGSRHLGREVSNWYRREGQTVLKAVGFEIPYMLTWLEGEMKDRYLSDMMVTQEFAALNREIMIREIADSMQWKIDEMWSCIHNYVEMGGGMTMLRKGAISAKKGERVAIPITMRDGLIIGTGLGNEEWNFSAPHGAGRILKREDARNLHTLSEFKASMKGVYSSSICRATLDEAPFAYRAMSDIREAIASTVAIEEVLKPIYNFKSADRAE